MISSLSLRSRLEKRPVKNHLTLIIQDRTVLVAHVDATHRPQVTPFANSAEGVASCAARLDALAPRLPVHLLLDIQGEEAHPESIPALWGRNRRELIARRLERRFRATPFRAAESQGRHNDGNERLLLRGITEPGRVQPWLDLLRDRNRPVAGIWSVPLLTPLLRTALAPESDAWSALITFHPDGHRQTLFHQGQPLSSRLIAGRSEAGGETLDLALAEIDRTRLYLASLRRMPNEQPGQVLILAPDDGLPALQAAMAQRTHPCATCQTVPLGTTARDLGFTPTGSQDDTNLLFMFLLLARRRPPGGYSLPEPLSWRARLTARFYPRARGPEPLPVVPGAPRLGDLLVTRGVISADQLAIALDEQQRQPQPLGKIVVALGFVPERTLRDLLGDLWRQESIDLDPDLLDPAAARILPAALAKRHRVAPISWSPAEHHLVVAMANPLEMTTHDKIRAQLPPGATLTCKLATESAIHAAIDALYGVELSVDGILHEIESGEVDAESLEPHAGEFAHPLIRLVDALLLDAIRHDASDLHFSPMDGFMRIRYRIDGVLREVRSLPRKFQAGITVRLKVMSGMDIAETRLPQDGHFSRTIAGRGIDFRVSTQPTLFGENLVLRVLDRSRGQLSLDALGLSAHNRAAIDRMMAQPEGIILVTGPTGSGKTTTLYSMIAALDASARNIMTQEDPVEYPMPSILQTQVNEGIQLDFATGVRSILRQDPDIILVGEIRDPDTARMALRAAMTGHQVYSTLHTNSALGAMPRLLDMGVEPHALTGNIIGVLAQRLLRRLCPRCKSPHPLDAAACRLLGVNEATPPMVFRAIGCPACGQSGYKGRMCVMEALIVDETMNDLIARRAHPAEFRVAARERGFVPLHADGARRVIDGETSLEELTRVLGVQGWEDRAPSPGPDAP